MVPTAEELTAGALALLPPGTELPDEFDEALGEVYVPVRIDLEAYL